MTTKETEIAKLIKIRETAADYLRTGRGDDESKQDRMNDILFANKKLASLGYFPPEIARCVKHI
jgi:hypothetical protein